MTKGIDVSKWQGEIDWARVKNSGVEFAIIRVGAGQTSDEYFKQNITNARAVGLKVGVYYYTKAKNTDMIDKELSVFTKAIGAERLDLPVFWDMEDITLRGLGGEILTENMLYALKKIKGMGYECGIYSNPDWLTNVLDYSKLYEYPLWLACWTSEERRKQLWKGRVDYWQYTATRVDGISTDCDVNIGYADIAEQEQEQKYKVKVSNCIAAWIRSGAGTEYSIVSLVTNGKTLETDGTIQKDARGVEWLKVYLNRKVGWIGARYTRMLTGKLTEKKE